MKYQQVVVVYGYKSEVNPVHSGVPQGLQLGPLFFMIHESDNTPHIETNMLL